MKGYTQPKKIEKGTCFICGKECKDYCHQECALAMAEERDKRKEQAKAMEKFT